MSKQINIGGRIHSTEVGNVAVGANEVLDDTKGKNQNVINADVDAELLRLDQSKQDNLTFDNAPTENSNNPVKSSGVYAADKALSDAIEAILLLIPSAATALNKLVDTETMNSSISTATATPRGTYNVVTDLELTIDATHEQIATKLCQVIAVADKNDYAFVQIPVSAESTDIRKTERYKFNGTVWGYEYDLNTSGFTQAQWNAINSAITSALVAKLSALPTADELATALAGKQATLTFDNAPTSGSDNPVKSGGVYTAVNDEKVARENADTGLGNRITSIENVIPSAASSSNKLVDNSSMSDAIGVVTALIGQMDATFNLTTTDGHITLHVTQVNGVITSVQVQSSDIASAAALTLVTNRVTTAEGDITSLSGRMTTAEGDIETLQDLYNALQQSAPQVIEPTDTWPVVNPSTTVIYRVIDRVNTPPEYYSDYMLNGTSMVLMATYNNAIDTTPKKDSANLITSGGVFANIGAFDVSEYHKSGGTLATYADLSAALAAVPTDYQKGGMSIKFVQSSDNKYAQYRCMAQSFTTDVTQWQGVDNTPISEGKNLIESGGVYPLQAKIFGGNLLGAPKNGMIVTDGKYSSGNNVAKHYLVPVSQGDIVYIKWNSVCESFYCVLNTYNFVVGQYCDFATGWDAVKHLHEDTFEIPSDGHYLYVLYIGSDNSNHTPDIVTINGDDYILKPLDTIIDSMIGDIDSLEESVADINDEVFGYHRIPDIITGSINSAGAVSNSGTCWFIPFTEGNTAVITSNNTKKAQYVLVNAYNMQSKTITYATGYSVPIEIPVNQSSVLITAPSDCNYLYIYNTDKYENSYFPSKIVINGEDYLDKPSLNAKIIAVDSKIDALEESVKAPTFSAFGEQEQQLIHDVLSDKDSNTITFGLITDTHNSLTSNVRRTAKQAYYIGKLCELASASFVVNLGDVIHGGKSTHQENMDDLVDYWKQAHRTFIPTLYTIAHHEQYGEDGEFQNYPSSLYPTECIGVYGMTSRYVNVTWSNDKTNWYFDENGVRFIGINSSSNGSLGFSQEVIDFLQTALNTCTTPVVCMAHVVCNTNINYGIARNEEVIETALSNYQHGVIAYFHGHTHWDMIWKLTGIPYLYWSTCCAQAVQTAIDYKHAPTIGVPENYVRTVGEYSELCFDIVNIHKDTGVVKSFRFGVGYDRVTHNDLSVTAGNTLTLVPTIGGTIEWDIYDSTSGYIKDAQEQTATLNITRDVATINSGVVSALSAGISIAVASNGTAKEFFYITVS